MTTSDALSPSEMLGEIGPIDYIVLEWPGRQPSGEAVPLLLDLVDRGVIRILDVAFLVKDEAGETAAFEVGEAGPFGEFAGASSGIIGQDDLDEAAKVLEPGTSAAVLIWENRWAAPVVAAMRRSGGQLVASGRVPVDQIVAALDALETA